MTTISVPLSDDLLNGLEQLIQDGVASNKADGLRRALKMYLEEKAVLDVLRASKEPRLKGDLDALARKFS